MTNPTTSTNAREARIAEETVSAIDFMSRLLGAIEDGNWRYALDKVSQLERALKNLRRNLARTDQAAVGGPVAATIRSGSQHYRIGRALYGPRTGPAPSPLAQAEQAKRERDLLGELGALTSGYDALTSAPWYPAQAGDIVHVHYEAVRDVQSACGETYLVDHDEQEGGLVLKLLRADAALVGPGAFEGGVHDPLMEAWMEAGPTALTIVRAGRVIHGQGADVR